MSLRVELDEIVEAVAYDDAAQSVLMLFTHRGIHVTLHLSPRKASAIAAIINEKPKAD